MGVPALQTGPIKIRLLNRLSNTHKIFKVSKCKEKIKFDKIWGYRMGVPVKRGRQNSNFLTTHARNMQFSGLANMKKSYPKRGPPKFLLFSLLSWTREMVVMNNFPN